MENDTMIEAELARFETGNELMRVAEVLESLARKVRSDAVVRLRDAGVTLAAIAQEVGLSPQMIHKLEQEGRGAS